MDAGIDVVVVSYRTPQDLSQFLHSFDQFRPSVAHTLTVVNVSPRRLDVDVVRRFQAHRHDGEVHYLAFADNVGYARACNAAGSRGGRQVLALFNADVVLTEGALDVCYGALMAQPEWAILGPRQVDERSRLTHAGIFGTLNKPEHRGWHHRDNGAYADVRDDAVTVSGSAFFVKRSVWDELTSCEVYRDIAPDAAGAFLPTQHYFDETWCAYHAQAHGYRCVYFGPVSIVHKWHRASPMGGWAEQQWDASQAYFRRACDHHSIRHN